MKNSTQIQSSNLCSVYLEPKSCPAFANRNYEELWLYKNQISEIEAGAFRGLEQLKKLSLSHNELSSLAAGIFSDLPKLERLDLSQNKLTEIQSHLLDGLYSLKDLSFWNNKITTLHPGCFSTPSPT